MEEDSYQKEIQIIQLLLMFEGIRINVLMHSTPCY